MFSLDEAIAEWRDSLSRYESFREEDGDELESHLREQMTHLGDAGLTEEEAFRVAAFRMGDTARLACEFGKVNGDLVWRRRFMWMVVGVLGYLLCESFARTAWAIGLFAGVCQLTAGWGVLLGLAAYGAVWLGAVWSGQRQIYGRTPVEDWPKRGRQLHWACALGLTLVVLALFSSRFVGRIANVWTYEHVSPSQIWSITSRGPVAWMHTAWSFALPILLTLVFFRLWSRSDAHLREE